jgi:RHS repeat-associated protein
MKKFLKFATLLTMLSLFMHSQWSMPAVSAQTPSGLPIMPAPPTPASPAGTEDNRFLFNGKENQITGNLGLLDYGTRMYDPEIGRMLSPDRAAEQYYPHSPYAFTGNNPVRHIELDGDIWVDANGRAMWENGQWTQYATKDAMRAGTAMRATETGMKTFNQVASSPSEIQINISPDIVIEGGKLVRGALVPNSRDVLVINGEIYPKSATIMIYEGSLQAEINGTVPTSDDTGKLIKSLPNEISINGAIGSVGVHEGAHLTSENMKQQVENKRAGDENKSTIHDIEQMPVDTQNQYLNELLNR